MGEGGAELGLELELGCAEGGTLGLGLLEILRAWVGWGVSVVVVGVSGVWGFVKAGMVVGLTEWFCDSSV